MKIRTLFIFALLFFSLSSIITYAVYCSNIMNKVAEEQYERLYANIAVNETVGVDNYISTLTQSSSVLAQNETLKGFSLTDGTEAKNAADAAEAFVNADTGISRVIVFDKNGAVVAQTSNPDNIKYHEFTAEQVAAMNQGDAYICPVYDDNDRATEYEFAAPTVLDDRIIIAFFFADDFDLLVKAGNFPVNGRTVFVDGMGNIIDSSYRGIISEVASKQGYEEYSRINNAITDPSKLNSSLFFDVNRTTRVSYTSKCSNSNWYVATLAEADKAYTYSSEASSQVVGLIVGLSILFAAVYVVAVILVTKPLTAIRDTLTKIHRGDHDSRIDINSKNEYKDIADSFNNLLDNVVVSEKRYRTIVEMSDDIVFEWNLKSNNITFSNNFIKKFSYRAPSDHFSDCFLLKGKVHPDDVERYRKDLEGLEKGEEFKDNTYRWKNIFGDYIWMQMKTSTVRDNEGNIVKIIGVLSDVDRAKKGELQLLQRASYDALTGVYNRESIESVINNEISKMAEGSDKFAILFVDIDDFKIYNDKYSHTTGDQVLKFVTDSIGEIVGDYGYIGRYGGDEFIVCARNVTTNIPENIAKDILAKLKAGFVCDTDDHLTVSVSIGVYIVNDSSKTVEEIISIADDAMYKIKKNGKSSFGIVNNK